MLFHATSAMVLAAAGQFSGHVTAVEADLNGDGKIDKTDVVLLLRQWGPPAARATGGPADLDSSGEVDEKDLARLLDTWLMGPAPGVVLAPAPTPTHLAGNKLPRYPFFDYVRAFNQGAGFHVAIDPTRFPAITGQTCRIYIVRAKTRLQWATDASLVDVRPTGFQLHTFSGTTIQGHTVAVVGGSAINGTVGTLIGLGYDVVFDCNQNAILDSGDFIDGLSDEAGMYVVRDTTAAGPFSVTEITYNITPWTGTPGFAGENTFYPNNPTADELMPLIIISHGNGHNYQWYDHLGNHLASYGYVVMSHQNNTMPGVITASTTTLEHTDAFVQQVTSPGPPSTPELIPLDGRVDTSRIIWVGHSRGGEGVTIAYDRVFDGMYIPTGWNLSDIQLVSSIAPVDFQGGTGNPGTVHDGSFHLWTAGADSDVNGCANCNLCQTFHLHDRAEQFRQSISLHGVGHGDFHNGGGGSVAHGPCLVGRPRTHQIMRGYILPLVKKYMENDIPSKDFLWRQWEGFKPIGAPAPISCPPPDGTGDDIVVDLMYRDGPVTGNFVIDDFQTQPSLNISSSGGGVIFSGMSELIEGDADDNNSTFTWVTSDLMNSVTLGGNGDTTKALAATWSGAPASITWRIVDAQANFADDVYLSFRIAQASRHPNTTAVLADLSFNVELIDFNGTVSGIDFAAYGGGVEEPYQRVDIVPGWPCGDATPGWAAEFETIRIRLTDFLNNGSGLDLRRIIAVRFNFGGGAIFTLGRVVVDDLEVTKD